VTQADPTSVTDHTDVAETVAVLEQVTCASLIFDRNILLMRGSEHFTSETCQLDPSPSFSLLPLLASCLGHTHTSETPIKMTYPNAVYSVFAFVGFVLCAISFPWHFRGIFFFLVLKNIWTHFSTSARNIGTCLYMFWAGLGCLNYSTNAIIWTGNAINWAPVWCDICEWREVP
jgi:hypothetical protein